MRIRLEKNNTVGFVALPAWYHLTSAKATAAAWVRELGPTWRVRLFDAAEREIYL